MMFAIAVVPPPAVAAELPLELRRRAQRAPSSGRAICRDDPAAAPLPEINAPAAPEA